MTAPPPVPAELARFGAHLPAEAVLALVEAFGGRRIYIPKEPNQASPLAQALGREAALALAAAMGGEEVEVPLAKFWRILAWRARGESHGAIAARLGTTERVVRRHLHDHRARQGQADLFG